jgi:uncharacterized membrane protein
MPVTSFSGLRLLWAGLTVGYLAASALGFRAAALVALGLMAGALVGTLGRRFLGLVVGVALAAAAWRFADAVAFLAFIPPLAAFAFMAFFFGRTLRAGSEPLINRIARKEQSELPPDTARYARGLTGVWAICFATLFLVALGLAPLLSLEAWSRWVQCLGYVVPGALFLGEYAYRHHRFPHRPHSSLAVLIPNVLAVIREIAMESGRRAAPGSEPR